MALLATGMMAAPLPAAANVLMNSAVLPLAVQMVADTYCAAARYETPVPLVTEMAYGAVPGASKASAILGGAPSRLEQMRLQQQGQGTSLVATKSLGGEGIVNALTAKPLQPALGGSVAGVGNCGSGTAQSAVPARAAYLDGASDSNRSPEDFLASKRVSIGHTMFDGQWSHVRYAKVSRGQLARAVGHEGRGNALALIAQVNRWTNQNIRYVEDSELWGKPDLWAGANTTLRLRKGDCEDIAITKMQLLAAAGIARKDMILTVARDLVRNADHALLIIRHEGRYLMLDNSTDRVLDARYSYDYRPVLSFSEGQTWLHGY